MGAVLPAHGWMTNPLLSFENSEGDGMNNNFVNYHFDGIGARVFKHHPEIAVDLVGPGIVLVKNNLHRGRGLQHRTIGSRQASGKGDFFAARPR